VTVYYQDTTLTLLLGDAVEQLGTLPDGSVDCVVTSPPYFGLRDYAGHPEQIGLEESPAEYVARLVEVFAEVQRVLTEDGTLWLNLGDSYTHGGSGAQGVSGARAGRRFTAAHMSGSCERPPKNLLGIPWRVAFALQDAGWYLRNAIVWTKPNAMPESVQDRLSNRYEFLFLLTKSKRYWFDLDAIREPATDKALARARSWSDRKADGEPVRYGLAGLAGVGSSDLAPHEQGRNPGDVWPISTCPLPDAHFAAFPSELPRRCILAGCKPGGTVLDPFSGAGTTAMVAQQLGRRAIGIDLIAAYHDIALRRMSDAPLPFLSEEPA
jgi:site-specific DNA-methyltransferase (cytosine-N4-specific)